MICLRPPQFSATFSLDPPWDFSNFHALLYLCYHFFLKEFKGLRIIRLKDTNGENELLQKELHLLEGAHIVVAGMFLGGLLSSPTRPALPSWTTEVASDRDGLYNVLGNSALWAHFHASFHLRRYFNLFFLFKYKRVNAAHDTGMDSDCFSNDSEPRVKWRGDSWKPRACRGKNHLSGKQSAPRASLSAFFFCLWGPLKFLFVCLFC